MSRLRSKVLAASAVVAAGRDTAATPAALATRAALAAARATARATVIATRATTVAAVVACACALLTVSCRSRGPDWRIVALYGGGTSTDVLAKPLAVEAFRIDPALPPKDASAPRIGDFAITSGPVALDAAAVQEMSSVLLDPDTYDWARAKGCDFMPGVGLRFVKDASRVEIALCFECDELMIFRMGRRVGMEDFDTARPRLVAVMKRLFPDDPKIQALE